VGNICSPIKKKKRRTGVKNLKDVLSKRVWTKKSTFAWKKEFGEPDAGADTNLTKLEKAMRGERGGTKFQEVRKINTTRPSTRVGGGKKDKNPTFKQTT